MARRARPELSVNEDEGELPHMTWQVLRGSSGFAAPLSKALVLWGGGGAVVKRRPRGEVRSGLGRGGGWDPVPTSVPSFGFSPKH